MIFPDLDAPLRNDCDFRARIYEGHHKYDTILESIIGLDMVNDFPIGDALHLIDLGITKRFLNGWKSGSLNNHNAKWSAQQIDAVSKYMQGCKLPREFNRPVRSLEHLSRWKGTEFRTFLLYLSPIITTKFFDCSEISDHFLNFFFVLCRYALVMIRRLKTTKSPKILLTISCKEQNHCMDPRCFVAICTI